MHPLSTTTHLISSCAGPACAAAVSVSSYVYQSCHVWKTLLPQHPPSPLALGDFPLHLPQSPFPEPWGEGSEEEIPFRIECSKISHSAHCPVVVSVFVPMTAEGGFSGDG